MCEPWVASRNFSARRRITHKEGRGHLMKRYLAVISSNGRTCRTLITLLAILALLLVGPTLPAGATNTNHYPAWSDNFAFSYANGDHTTFAANPATAQQRAINYNGTEWNNASLGSVTYYLQNDAVWAIYAHANPDAFVTNAGDAITRGMVLGYNLGGLKVAVFYGCNGAMNYDNITRAAAQVGAGASLGFSGTVYMQVGGDGLRGNPAFVWSDYFWAAMSSGNSIGTSAGNARNNFQWERGDTGGTETYVIYGNGNQTITPAGYK